MKKGQKGPREAICVVGDTRADRQGGNAAPFLQDEVREGREAREAGVVSKAVIAKCNKTVLLQLELFIARKGVLNGTK